MHIDTMGYEIFVRRAGIKAHQRDLVNLIELEAGKKHYGVNREKTRAMIISNIQRAITKLINHKELSPENREVLSRYDGQTILDATGMELKEIGDDLREATKSLKHLMI